MFYTSTSGSKQTGKQTNEQKIKKSLFSKNLKADTMGFNRMNLLRRMIEVQTLVLQYQKEGRSQRWIHKTIIYPKYLISIATYYRFLATNAKKELKELEAMKKETICNCNDTEKSKGTHHPEKEPKTAPK